MKLCTCVVVCRSFQCTCTWDFYNAFVQSLAGPLYNAVLNTSCLFITYSAGLSTPSIIGIVIGSIAFIAICVLTITVPICARKYSRKRATQSDMVYREPQTMQNHYEPSFSISPPPSYFSLFSQTRSPRYESLQEEYPPSFN